MKGTHDLRHGVLWKQILLFALPIAATSMLQQLFNSADVAVVGQFSAQKELALAAVGSTSSIVNLYILSLIHIYLDASFCRPEAQKIGVHPNDNTATLWLQVEDLLRLIRAHGNPVHVVPI